MKPGDEAGLKTAASGLEEAHDVESGKDKSPAVSQPTRPHEQEPAGELPERKQPACNQTGAAGMLTMLYKYPNLLILPAVLFCLVVALSVFGVVHATNASYDTEGRQAWDAAVSSADGIAKQLSYASTAALSLAAVVKMNPDWSFLEANFLKIAKELFRQANDEGNLVIKELALIPFGRVRLDYAVPYSSNTTRDLFSAPFVTTLGTLRSIKERDLTVNGPIPLEYTEKKGFAARYPVFFPDTDEDESWNHPDNITHPTNCSGPPCYIPETREKFWGFTGALVNAAPLLSGLKTADHAPACYLEPAYLCCKCISIWFAQTWTPYAQSKRPAYSFVKASAPGLSVVHGCFHPVALSVCLAGRNVHLERLLSDDLSYSLTTSFLAGANGPGTLVSGGSFPDKVTANVTVNLPGTSWALSVYNPRQDEILQTRKGLLAMVVVAAFFLSVLLLLLLLSAKKASVLLQEQLVTYKLLEEEEVSKGALLGRQLDLIACFERSARGFKNRSRSKLVVDGQQSTLERIASARAAISEVRHSKDEDIAVLELLAEGSFGKVYRGKWRGTDVAVKIIMLPGNMSGREKREKMVVWEAAISSSLIHPNVCQTYHYRIKPIKESAKSGLEMTDFGSAVVFSDVSSSRAKSGLLTDSKGQSESSGSEDVHSYEVQLVLEYCDRSSLRDALDAGVFMTPTGLNYAAQLDCAMDVAKAMLHLHCNNVLHLDLKTRNVLLASSGTEGKGVICKVSDFGLSVRMDHSATHVSSMFQGTMTHMAPETLLKGTCSKASDVYAFGIVMWELFTCGSPFRGVPAALLGHSIVKGAKRPAWPVVVPSGYKDLANACWDQNPDARPSFEVILEVLQNLRKELGTSTSPLPPIPIRRPENGRPKSQEGRAGPFSLLAQEEEAARSADLLLEGRGGFVHPRSGTWEKGAERTTASNVSNDPVRSSPTTSVLAALQAQYSLGPGVRSASPVRDPHAVVPRVSSDSHSSSRISKGSFRPSRPSSRTGPSRMKRSVKQGGTGETLLVIGEEEGGSGIRSSRHKQSLLLQTSQLPSICEDDALHRLSSSP